MGSRKEPYPVPAGAFKPPPPPPPPRYEFAPFDPRPVTLADVERLAQEAGERLLKAERSGIAAALREMAAGWRDHVSEQDACKPCAEEGPWLAAAGDLEAFAKSVEQGGFRV